MISQRQALEDAVIHALRQSNSYKDGSYLKYVGPYAGEMAGLEGAEDPRRVLQGQTPAILVTTGNAEVEPYGNAATRFIRNITLVCYAISQSGDVQENRTRMSAPAKTNERLDPGVYKIMEDMYAVLAGNDFGVSGVGRCVPQSEQRVYRSEDFEAWSVEFSVRIDSNLNPRDFGDCLLTGASVEINEQVLEVENPMVISDTELE